MNTINPVLLVEQKKAVEHFKVHNSVFLRFLRENKIKVLRGNFIPAGSLEEFNSWNDKRIAKRKAQLQEIGRRVGKLKAKEFRSKKAE